MGKIHPTAILSPDVQVSKDAEIGPYVIIEGNVKVGAGTTVGPFAHLQGNTEIGDNCHIFTGAVIGSIPQDLKYRGEKTYLKIGNDNTIREYVTINPGTAKNEYTTIGNGNLFMAYSHVAHNCRVGNHVIVANAGTLAGHIVVDDWAIIGGVVGVHQFCRIGKHAIIGGCSKVVKDIVPFAIADGHPALVNGINKIGLRRRNFSNDVTILLERAYKILFRSGLNTSCALKELEKIDCDEVRSIIDFIRTSERGIAKEK